jgi:translation initiation factor 2B subunit (eIF-2B alpha/beta/delta family)
MSSAPAGSMACPYDDRMDDAWARVERAAADSESGAAQIARRAAAALGALAGDRISAAVEVLLHGHPSMAPLWRLADEVLSAGDPEVGARSFLAMLDADRGAPEVMASVLPDRVLTLSYSSTVVEAIRLRRPQQTVCMRSDPGGEGWRVAEETRDCTWPILMDDADAIDQVPAEAILVGADAVTPGGMVNKVKSRELAEAARARGIPRYVVAGETKLLGFDLPVTDPFELTALDLFTAIALPGGLLSPEPARERAAAIRLPPDLEDLRRSVLGT